MCILLGEKVECLEGLSKFRNTYLCRKICFGIDNLIIHNCCF